VQRECGVKLRAIEPCARGTATPRSRIVRLLLPSDPLNPRQPDSSFKAEVDAIETSGIPFDLLDLDALLAGSAARAVRRVDALGVPLLYRGWMMPVSRSTDSGLPRWASKPLARARAMSLSRARPLTAIAGSRA